MSNKRMIDSGAMQHDDGHHHHMDPKKNLIIFISVLSVVATFFLVFFAVALTAAKEYEPPSPCIENCTSPGASPSTSPASH